MKRFDKVLFNTSNPDCHNAYHCGNQDPFKDCVEILPNALYSTIKLFRFDNLPLNTIESFLDYISSEKFHFDMDQVEFDMNLNSKKIIFQLMGPFSIFMEIVGASKTFIWLKKDPERMEHSLIKLAHLMSDLCEELSKRRVRVISYANPSARRELMSPNDLSFIFRMDQLFLKILKKKKIRNVVHICPLLSYEMQNEGLIAGIDIGNRSEFVQTTLFVRSLQESNQITGNACIYGRSERLKLFDVL